MAFGARVPGTLVTGFLVAAILAGCIGDDRAPGGADGMPTVDLEGFVNPLVMGHDHSDPALHAGWAWNFERTWGQRLDAGLRSTAMPHALDVKNGMLFVSAYAATGDPVAGLYIFDVATDPQRPGFLGKVTWPGPAGGDRNMEATEDGRFVVYSMEARDCAGNINPYLPGIWLIDTSDPTNPQIVDQQPVLVSEGDSPPLAQSGGEHSITIHSTADGDYVYHGGGDSYIHRIDRSEGRLEQVGRFRSGHDTSLFHDPVGDRMLLLSADVSRLAIFDLADPVNPEPLGSWRVPRPDTYYVHTAVADHIDGRNVAVVNSEDFRHDPTIFWVLDITDPAAIGNLSYWTAPGGWDAPGGVPSGDLLFSLHNPRIAEGVVSFSFYHGGVWQFDLNEQERRADPRPRAYYLPTENHVENPPPDGLPVMSKVCGVRLSGTDNSLDVPMDSVPFTFDVELYEGVVYAADINTGVHALRFAPDST